MKHFIHIPKTAGIALVRNAQTKNKFVQTRECHLPGEYLDKLAVKYGKNTNIIHARARDLLPNYKATLFSVVRNPWSRVVSRWTYMKKLISEGNNIADVSFNEFIEQRNICEDMVWHRVVDGWCQQYDYVVDKGKLRCDILRFEKLNQDVNSYFNTFGKLQYYNTSSKSNINYRDIYNKKTKQIVAEWYAEDIEYFGFTYDGTATKNIWNIK